MKFLIEESLIFPFGDPVKKVALYKQQGQSWMFIAAGFKTSNEAEDFAKEYKECFKEKEIDL